MSTEFSFKCGFEILIKLFYFISFLFKGSAGTERLGHQINNKLNQSKQGADLQNYWTQTFAHSFCKIIWIFWRRIIALKSFLALIQHFLHLTQFVLLFTFWIGIESLSTIFLFWLENIKTNQFELNFCSLMLY